MAQIDFYTGGNSLPVYNFGGSGLGFFGAGGFGTSVSVAGWQDTTYITNGNGTVLGPQGNNVKFIHTASGQLPSAVNLALTSIPNYQATANIRFTHTTAVRVQNAQLRMYDRNDINAGPTGVTVAVAAIIHPNPVQGATGSGSASWLFPAGSSVTVNMSLTGGGVPFSPGLSGTSPNGINTSGTQHDFYVAISASPNSIGSKLFAAYFSCEYL